VTGIIETLIGATGSAYHALIGSNSITGTNAHDPTQNV